MVVFLNDQFVDYNKAALHVSDLAIQRGYGIFDFFRVRENVLLYVEDHLDRFFHSASCMHLSVPYPKEKILGILTELKNKNAAPQSAMRMILTGGYSPDAYEPAKSNLVIIQSALNLKEDANPKSVRIISHEYVRDIPEAKTINYTMGIWLQKKLREEAADDVLYHANGFVTEFPRCNFFIVTKENEVITPARKMLKGVTRKRVLEVASVSYRVREQEINLDDILQAKEAFLTSSTKRIQSVVSLDGHKIGEGEPGEVTKDLLKKLIDKELAYVKSHS